eukprot:scaffold647854_cov49-Prasinocladus_malaysianus.AAC.2
MASRLPFSQLSLLALNRLKVSTSYSVCHTLLLIAFGLVVLCRSSVRSILLNEECPRFPAGDETLYPSDHLGIHVKLIIA